MSNYGYTNNVSIEFDDQYLGRLKIESDSVKPLIIEGA